ncbi:hypothetical protein HWV62_30191 [Athelia sp. TMB]|nr:hypothetical protein HWV62_30191 [Athelia sp. TMB]
MPSIPRHLEDLPTNPSSMAASRAVFPAELTDIIIDFLHADRPALAACSLACRAWLPAARLHLFRHVDITVHTWRRLECLLYGAPHIAARVRSVSLAVEDPAQRDWARADRLAWFHMELCGLLSHVPSVRAIQVRGGWAAADTTHFFLGALRTLREVAEIDISELAVAKFSVLVGFLAHFPALRRVSVSGVDWETSDEPHSALRLPHTAALELRIEGCPKHSARRAANASPQLAHHFVAWLARQPRPPEVRTFLLHVEHDRGRLARDLLCSPLAASLRTLYLRCGWRLGDGAHALAQGISRCVRLQELHFGALPLACFNTRHDALARILAAPGLRRVSFALALQGARPAAVRGGPRAVWRTRAGRARLAGGPRGAGGAVGRVCRARAVGRAGRAGAAVSVAFGCLIIRSQYTMERQQGFIPQELVDTIIDFLHTDRASLAASSLTCRAWLPAARYHLFHAVKVDIYTFPRILKLFKTSSHIAALVKTLSLSIENEPELEQEQLEPEQGQPEQGSLEPEQEELEPEPEEPFLDIDECLDIMTAQLHDLTALLPSVRSMKIFQDWRPRTPSTTWNFLRAMADLSQVTRLDLFHFHIDRFSFFIGLLCAFPALEKASLYNVSWDIEDKPDMTLPLAHPVTLKLGMNASKRQALHFFRWLERQRPLPQVHTFLISVEYKRGRLTRHVLQSALASSIRTLNLRYDAMFAEGTDELVKGLDRCTRLQNLHFGPMRMHYITTYKDTFARILLHVRSEELRVVSFALWCSRMTVDPLDWDTLQALDEMLRSSALSDLCRVEVFLLLELEETYSEVIFDIEHLQRQWGALGNHTPLFARTTAAWEYNNNFGTPPTAVD